MADITDRLIVKKENGVGRIMLDNQARRNAMTFEMWQSLPRALDDFMADDNIRVIVVSGKGGKAFCAGADISQFEKNRSSEEATAMYNEVVSKPPPALPKPPSQRSPRSRDFVSAAGWASPCVAIYASLMMRRPMPCQRPSWVSAMGTRR